MDLIPYDEFSKLRIKDFYPKGTEMSYEDTGFECVLGLAGQEGFPFTYFAWPEDRPGETAQISLDFRNECNECPPDISEKILSAIRLPLAPGMTKEQIVQILGEPLRVFPYADNAGSCIDFLCGDSSESQYEVQCDVHPDLGLIGVRVVREDLREK